MSQHVTEGAEAEDGFVVEMNKNKNDPRWKHLGIDAENHYAVRVTTQKMSKIHGKKVPCKSDVFVAKSEKEVDKFHLTENDLENYGLEPVNATGISIKKDDAKNIQWQKLGINAVRVLFGNTELGAGISLYKRKGTNHQSLNESMNANQTIVEKWCSSIENFVEFYGKEIPSTSKLFDSTESDEIRHEIVKEIGKIADKKMKEVIDNDEELQKKIFWGIGVFEEPFCASYVFEDSKLRKTTGYTPKYSITTGNSRTKNFTIAIKGSK